MKGVSMKIKSALLFISIVLVFFGTPCILFAGNGYFLHGVGAVNESLGGAAVAGNSQDLVGSLHRNPANGILFDGRIASVNLGALFPKVTINSSVTPLGLSGSSDSDVDFIPCVDLGIVFNDNNTPTAFYFAVISEDGVYLDMPESTTNPIFMPQAGKPNNPFGGLFGGFGHVVSQLEVVRIPLGISYQLDSKWAMGLSVAPSVSRMKFTPAAFAAPDDANGDGIPTYPDKVDHALALGIGFQAGIRYQATDQMGIGFTFTTPTWFEKFKWDVEDEVGKSREISFRLNRPLSIGLGTTYQLTPATLLLMDFSWINYSSTEGFEDTGYAQDGSISGLGWDDIWVIAFGVQHDVNDNLTLRTGYNYSTNPIDQDITFFNVGTPLHVQHHLSVGGSWRIFKQTSLDISYSHGFKSSQASPWYDVSGQVAGTEVETKVEYDQVTIGVTFSF